MIAIVNFNKKAKKYLPLISLQKDEETAKKMAKKQLINEIIENPLSLKAYKEIEVHKIADVNEKFDINLCEKTQIFSFEELLDEIIKGLTEDGTK